MAEARHFCPDCGSIDLVIERKYVTMSAAEDTGATAKCPNCSWDGALSKTLGAVSAEQFWDIERVGDVLLRVVQKNAAGPMVQVLEFAGLLPRLKQAPDEEVTAAMLADHNALAQQCRDIVMREVFEASITAGFAAAERAHRIYAVKMNMPLHPMLKAVAKPAS